MNQRRRRPTNHAYCSTYKLIPRKRARELRLSMSSQGSPSSSVVSHSSGPGSSSILTRNEDQISTTAVDNQQSESQPQMVADGASPIRQSQSPTCSNSTPVADPPKKRRRGRPRKRRLSEEEDNHDSPAPSDSNLLQRRARVTRKRDRESDSGEEEEVSAALFEYQWVVGSGEVEWYMLQEHVAEFLDIRGMQRRYPDLERRNVDVEEKKYLLETGFVTETQSNMGLVALLSNEVTTLMMEDFPTKYKEYQDAVADQEFNDRLQISEQDRKTLENSQVTQFPDNARELMRQAVQAAALYNQQCAELRKKNRDHCVDRHTKIQMVPRQAQSPVPYKIKSKYPVALLPGQYCDTVRQFTSEELFSLPLSTALSIPGVPKRKPAPVQPLAPIQPLAVPLVTQPPPQQPPQHAASIQSTTIPLAQPLVQQSATVQTVRFPSSTPTAAAVLPASAPTSSQSSPLLSLLKATVANRLAAASARSAKK